MIQYSDIPPSTTSSVSSEVRPLEGSAINEKFNINYTLRPQNWNAFLYSAEHQALIDRSTAKLIQKVRTYDNNLGTEQDIHHSLVVSHINDQVGYGVFATRRIQRGVVVALYAGDIKSEDSYDNNNDNSYSFGVGSKIIDAKYSGNISRFFQHLPNALSVVMNAMKNVATSMQKIEILSKDEIESLRNDIIELSRIHAGSLSKRSEEHLNHLSEEQKKLYLDIQQQLEENYLLIRDFLIGRPLLQEQYDQAISHMMASVHLHYLFTQSDDAIYDQNLTSTSYLNNIAYANLSSVIVGGHEGHPAVLAFISRRDILPGEMLGYSYGIDYWRKKQAGPCYFSRQDHLVIPPNTTDLEGTLRELRSPRLIEKYSATDIHHALRRAVAMLAQEDIQTALFCGANPHNAGPQSGKNAFDLLDEKKTQKCSKSESKSVETIQNLLRPRETTLSANSLFSNANTLGDTSATKPQSPSR